MKGGRSRAIEQVSVGMERKGGWDESYIVEFTWIGNRFQNEWISSDMRSWASHQGYHRVTPRGTDIHGNAVSFAIEI